MIVSTHGICGVENAVLSNFWRSSNEQLAYSFFSSYAFENIAVSQSPSVFHRFTGTGLAENTGFTGW